MLLAELQLMDLPTREDIQSVAKDRKSFDKALKPIFRSLEQPAIFNNAHVSAQIAVMAWCMQRLRFVTEEQEKIELQRMFMGAARQIDMAVTDPDSQYTVVIVRGAIAAKEFAFASRWLDHWETANYQEERVEREKTNQILSHRITIAEHQGNWSGVAKYAQQLIQRVDDHPQALKALTQAKQHLQESLDQIE